MQAKGAWEGSGYGRPLQRSKHTTRHPSGSTGVSQFHARQHHHVDPFVIHADHLTDRCCLLQLHLPAEPARLPVNPDVP
jgi:hypothetical protein